MRILLTNSPLGRPQPPVFPLGLAYLAAVLEDHEVTCFDAAVAEDPFHDLTEIMGREKPEVIGLSLRNIDTLTVANTFSYWPSFVGTVKHLRKSCPDAVLVVGGPGFSLFAQAIMEQLPELDLGVYLEGEQSFLELLDCLEHPGSVKGVLYRRNSGVLFSGPRDFLDLDSIPMPRRDILDLSAYQGPYTMGVQSKRGCALNCVYCTYPFLSGRTVRLRSPERVGEELEVLSKRYGSNEIFFVDNVFNCPVSHAEAICHEILRRKLDIRWTAYFGEQGITNDFVKLAVESGCVQFKFAPDGSNDASLRRLGKGVTRKQLAATYRLLERFPQTTFACGFIWNHPQTGCKDLRDLLSLVFQLMRIKNQAGLGLTCMRILPNTRLYEVAVREGRVKPDDHLLSPTFYDPFPLNSVTKLFKLVGKLRRTVRNRAGKTTFARS
jgi:putative variant cofactor biosynthesis B12-binding/radical SAM domain protein 1